MAVKEEKVARAAAPAVLPEGWRRVKFGDVVRDVKVTVDPETSGLERYVAGEHMNTDDLHIRRWGTIGDGYLGPAFHRKFVKGQVLYGSRRTYLRKVAVAEFDGICANTTFVLEPKGDDLLPELLPFIMQTESFSTHAVKQSRGSVNPYVNFRDIAWYEFALPPKSEQHRIAEILWAADEMFLRWEATQIEVDKCFISIRKEMVCDVSHPRKRLEECLTDLTPGKSLVGINQPAAQNEFGVLKVSAVGARGFDADENKRLVNPAEFRTEFKVNANDFLITRCNTRELVGRVCIVPSDTHNLMLSDKTIRLGIDEGVATKTFLLEALRSDEVRSQIEAVATGTGGAMKNISQNEIRSFLIPLPDIQTQQRITAVIESIMAAKQKINSHTENSRSCRKALLEALINPTD